MGTIGIILRRPLWRAMAVALGVAWSAGWAATPGTVVGWGYNAFGQIPAGLSGITAISAGQDHSRGLVIFRGEDI